MKAVFYFVLIFIGIGCANKTKKDDYVSPSLPEIILESTSVKLENYGRVIDLNFDPKSQYIFMTALGTPQFLSVLDKNGNLLGKTIARGEGPEEQLSSLGVQINENERILCSFDYDKNTMFLYNLDSIRSLSLANSFIKAIPFDSYQFNRPLYLGSGEVVDFSVDFVNDDIYLLGIFNSITKVKSLAKLPEFAHTLNEHIIESAYFANLTRFQHSGFIGISFFLTDRLVVIDDSGEVILTYFGPQKFEPSYTFENYGDQIRPIPDFEKAKLAYTSKLHCVDKKYMVAHHGRSIKGGETYNEILVYNDKLEPILSYKLDVPIDLMTLDTVQNRIIGYSTDIEGELHIFNLP